MSKVAVLLLALLAVHTVSFNLIEENAPNDDRVKVDFFFESLCPYCQQFIVGALKTAANTQVLSPLFRTSGRFATSTSTPTAMPAESKTVPAGASPANTASANARAT